MTTTAQITDLVDALDVAVGGEKLVVEADQLKDYWPGKSPFPALTPGVVVKVESADDVAAVLRVANEQAAPVVTRGGGFSIAGPPVPEGDDPIVIDMRALDRIVEIDEENMTVTAECGVIMADLEAAVAERGFEVHTVAVPRAYTTIGGVLSGVCGGGFPADVAEIGPSGQFLLGLRVVLPNGSILDTNAGGSNVNRRASSARASDGPHVTQMFVGDGGALGVKVQATLAIQPARREIQAGAYAFDTFEVAWAGVREVTRIGDEVPYSNLYVIKGPPWGLTFTVKAADKGVLAHKVGLLEGALERHGGVRGDAALMESAQANADMDPTWADQFISVDRGAIAAMFGNREFAGALGRLRELVEGKFAVRLEALGIEPIVFASPYGRHAVWVAITLPYDENMPGARAEVMAMTAEAYELVVSLGGYSEPHQGAVTNLLAAGWSPEFRAFFELLKRGVDPNGILNAGLWRG